MRKLCLKMKEQTRPGIVSMEFVYQQTTGWILIDWKCKHVYKYLHFKTILSLMTINDSTDEKEDGEGEATDESR